MKKLIIILIMLVLIVAVYGQPISPSGTLYFTMLHDTPSTFTSQGGKGLRVNTAEDAVEFYDLSAVVLGTGTIGNYVAAIADGTGIDGTASSEGATYTPTFDATELGAITWSDGSNASNIWTFDVSGTDHTMTAGSALMTFSGGLTTTLDLIVTGGDITLGTTSIFSGGDTASLNNIDALNATTETTIESAIDTLANLTSIGTIATGVWQGTDVGVEHGGTGASTLTDGGILLGSGTGAITALGVATNGQIPIGDGTTDPVLATITGTANEITVTNAAGTITLSLPNHAGTDISADLEEEVTEGSLADSTIVSADIKDGEVTEVDLNVTNAPGAGEDNYVLTYNHAATNFTWAADADSGGATAYDNIGDPTGAGSIGFADTETATYITATTATDFFEIQGTGAFGDISLFRVSQGTGNPTDGALIESVTADAEDNVDQLLLGNSTDDQVTFRIVEAGTFTIDVISDGTPQTQFSDLVTGNAGITVATTTAFSFGANRIDNGSDLIDGEMIAADTIDNDSIDWGDMTDLTTDGALDADVVDEAHIADNGIDSEHYNDASIDHEHLAPDVISGMTDVTSEDADYILIWDNTDSALKKVDMGEVRGAAGATAWDDIGDPDAAATIDFVTYTQTIDIGKSDSGGGSGLILDVTGLGAGADSVVALKITTATDGDSDYVPLEIYDNTNDLKFRIDGDGVVTINSTLSWASTAIGGVGNTLIHSGNSDTFTMNFGGTDVDLFWSDGALNFQNDEDGVDAIVNILGKDGGEKGILRVMSDGDDKYIELYHDDTDAQIVSSSGDVKTANLDVTTELTIPDGTDPDVDAAGEISLDTDGANEPNDVVLRTIDGGGTQVALAQEQKSFQATIIKPNDLADATRDACPIWSNETGMTFVITKIEAWSDTDDTTLNVEVVDSDGTGNNATVDALEIATGSGPYTVTETTITAANITANRMIFLDFDDTDDPGWVKVSICGYFLADVD